MASKFEYEVSRAQAREKVSQELGVNKKDIENYGTTTTRDGKHSWVFQVRGRGRFEVASGKRIKK